MIYKKILIMLLLSSCDSEVIIYKKSTKPCKPTNVQCLGENTYTFCLNKGKHSALLHFVFNCPRSYICNDSFKYPCVKDLNYDFTMNMLENSVRIDGFSTKLISDSSESTIVPTNLWSSLSEMFKPGMTLLPTPDLGITGLPTTISQLIKTELPTTMPVVTEKPTAVSAPFTITGNTTMLKTYASDTFTGLTTMLPTTTITRKVQNNALPVLPTIMPEPFTSVTAYKSDVSSLPSSTFRAPTTMFLTLTPITTMLPTNTQTTTELLNFTSKLILPTFTPDLNKSEFPTTDVSIKTMLPPVILKLTTITPTMPESTVTPPTIESPIHTPSTTTRSILTGISKPKRTATVLPTIRRRLTSSAFKLTSSTFPTATDGKDIDLTTIESREAIDVPTRRTVIKIKFKLKRKTTTARLRRRTTTRSRRSTTPRTSITPARYTPYRISVGFKPTIPATRTAATRQWPTPTATATRSTVTRSTTWPTPTVTATRTTVTRSSTRPTPTVTATGSTVTRSTTRSTPTVTATRTTVTRSSARPTPTVTATRSTVTRSTTRPTPTITRSTTRTTPIVTRSTARTTPTVTRSTTRSTPTVTRSTTRPTRTVTKSTARPTPTVTRSTTRPTLTVTRSTARPTPTVTRSTTRFTPTVTTTRTTVTTRRRRPTITITGTRSKPAVTFTRTTPTTTTTRTTTTTTSTTTTRRPTVTVTRTTPTAMVTTTTSIPTTIYVTTTRRSFDPPICTEPGKHPATDCDQYYECVTVWWWHEYRIKTCPLGYSFSEIAGDCVPSNQSECIN